MALLKELKQILANKTNYTKGRKSKIEYLVIHYTANDGDTAENNCKYFQRTNRNASANYFIDENNIIQSVKDSDTAWHCGTRGSYYSKARNHNSIGIELCPEKGTNGSFYFTQATLDNAINLIVALAKKYNISINNIIRHYDVTRKICPAPMVQNNVLWANFKDNIIKEINKKPAPPTFKVVDRVLNYDGKTEIIKGINHKEKNYFPIAEVSDILNLDISYNKENKATTIKANFKEVKRVIKYDGKTEIIKGINHKGKNYFSIADVVNILNMNALYNKENKSTTIK